MPNVWFCSDCQTKCNGQRDHPNMVARVDADKYCNSFYNVKSEKFFRDGKTNEKNCRNCKCGAKCHCEH